MFLLLLFTLALGQISEPKLVQQVNATVLQKGSIQASGGDIYLLGLNLTVPQTTGYQHASTESTTVTDSEGNELAHLSASAPGQSYSYAIRSNVTTNERITASLPESYSIPQELMRYTLPSAKVQSNSPEIRQFAKWITANSTTDFERVCRLAGWVHNHVKYNLGLVGQREDALWVLNNGEGVCVEYATLFAAFARSLGYPTRFVLGQAYGDYGWLGHAWNEVYIGKWVPVDATWLEVGHLDATHIEFSKGAEPNSSNTVVAKVSSAASIHWQKPEFAGESSSGVQVKVASARSASPPDSYSLSIASPILGFGDQTLVTFSMRGSDYRLIDLRLVPCLSDTPIISVSSPIRSVVLEPGKEAHVSWIVSTSNKLNPSIVYTCPLTLNSRYLKEKSIPVTVSKAASRSGFTAFLSDTSVALGGMLSVYVRATPGERITVYSDGHLETRMATAGTTKFGFVPAHAGAHTVYVASETGGVATLAFTVRSSPGIYIKHISLPKQAFVGEPASFDVTIEGPKAAHTLSVSAATNGSEYHSRLVVSGETQLNFTLLPHEPGEQALTVSIDGDSAHNTKSVPFFAYEAPSLSVGKPIFSEYNGKVVVSAPITKSNSVTNVLVSLGSQSQTLNGSKASFLVKQGSYKLSVRWYDISGAEHITTTTINAVKPYKGADIAGSYPFLFATMVAFALFLGFYAFSKIIRKIRG